MAACRGEDSRISANMEAVFNESVSSEVTAKVDSLREAAETKLIKRLINKRIESLGTIISDFQSSDTKIVLITSRFDCVSCVEAGFQIIDKIKKSSAPALKTYAAGITKEINYDIGTKYAGTVYEDRDNKLHEEIDYAPTPVIIVLMDDKIIDLHSPFEYDSRLSQNFINTYSVN